MSLLGQEVRRTRWRGQIQLKHHRWHRYLCHHHPSDSMTQFPAGSFPHHDMYFLVDFSVCLAFWGCLLSVRYFIIFIVRNRAIFSTLLV